MNEQQKDIFGGGGRENSAVLMINFLLCLFLKSQLITEPDLHNAQKVKSKQNEQMHTAFVLCPGISIFFLFFFDMNEKC